jgi:uncharacterized caspase-like protein/predicted negative regulator of RcsB-dependent stress response
VLLGLPSVASAEKRVALIFSAGKYEHLRPLENPRKDADLVEAALEKLDFDVTTKSDRDLERMRRALEIFVEDAVGADVALIFFAGHGVEIGGENRLLPVDADAASLETLKATSLPLEEVRAAAAKVAKSVLIVLDACRNDPFGTAGGEGRSAVALAPDVAAAVKPGLGRMGKAENTLFAFSAAPGETASDGVGENSPFSAAFARYLGTDGLEIRSVLTLVQQDVYDETRGAQSPYVESAPLDGLFFASQAGPLPEREALLLAMANVTPGMRAEVEHVAAPSDMPLAPLYGALIAADLKRLSVEERNKKLVEAAEAFLTTRADIRALSSNDPDVTRLRKEANQALELGLFDKADSLLKNAEDIGASHVERTTRADVANRLSLANSMQSRAGVASTRLDNAGAIAALEESVAMYESVDAIVARERETGRLEIELKPSDHTDYLNALAMLGRAHENNGATAQALISYQAMQRLARQIVDQKGDDANDDDAIKVLFRNRDPAPRNLATSIMRTGDLQFQSGDVQSAIKSYSEAIAIRRQLESGIWSSSDLKRELAAALTGYSFLLGQTSRKREAFEASWEAVKIAKSLVRAEDNGKRDVILFNALVGMGNRFLDQNSPERGLEQFEAARSAIPGSPSVSEKTRSQMRPAATYHIGRAQFVNGQTSAALASLRQARDWYAKLIVPGKESAGQLQSMADDSWNTGKACRLAADIDCMNAEFDHAQRILSSIVARDQQNIEAKKELAKVLFSKIEATNYSEDFSRGVRDTAHAENTISSNLMNTAIDFETLDLLGRMQTKLGDLHAWRKDWQAAVDTYARALISMRQIEAGYSKQLADFNLIDWVMRIALTSDGVEDVWGFADGLSDAILYEESVLRWVRFDIGDTLSRMANASKQIGAIDKAHLYFRKAIEILSSLESQNSDEHEIADLLFWTAVASGKLSSSERDFRAAKTAFSLAAEVASRQPPSGIHAREWRARHGSQLYNFATVGVSRRENLLAAQAIFADLAAIEPLKPPYAKIPELIRQALEPIRR